MMWLRRRILSVVFTAASLGPAFGADLEAVKAEQNLERRARKALENADKMLDAARDAYLNGRFEELKAALAEIGDSVRLAYQSLKQTGKNPRKRPKHFKRAEIATRQLLRRLDSFRDEMSYLDRDQLTPVIETVSKVNSDLLHDVMGAKR